MLAKTIPDGKRRSTTIKFLVSSTTSVMVSHRFWTMVVNKVIFTNTLSLRSSAVFYRLFSMVETMLTFNIPPVPSRNTNRST